MPRKIAKTSTTRGKGTRPNQDKGDRAPPRGLHQTRQQNRSISRKRTREADEPTSKRPRKNPKETTNGRVTTRTRANAQNTRQQPDNDRSEQQQTPRAAPTKQRQPSRSLTEADIPRIVDAFIEALDKRHRRRQIQDADEEVYSEDEDSGVSWEDPSADEEFSSYEVVLNTQYVLVTQLDICIIFISICACYVYACLYMINLACWFLHQPASAVPLMFTTHIPVLSQDHTPTPPPPPPPSLPPRLTAPASAGPLLFPTHSHTSPGIPPPPPPLIKHSSVLISHKYILYGSANQKWTCLPSSFIIHCSGRQ